MNDAANAADMVPIDSPFEQQELDVGHWDNSARLTLWEGNFRAVLISSIADPDAQVLIWVPHEGNWPGKS